MTIPATVTGVSGRMGRMLVEAAKEHPEIHLTGATERPGHDWIGRDLGECLGGAPLGLVVEDDPLEAFARSRAVFDFTSPAASVAHAALAAQARCVHVIGTTGFEDDHLAKLEAAARHSVQIRAGNFSLGVNLLCVMTEKVAKALGPGWDVEIVEMHHRHKVDAPSGTALKMGEVIADALGKKLDDVAVYAREGVTGERDPSSIGFATVRGGDVVGEHEVIFANAGERVILKHIATDRMIFSRGAMTAGVWGQEKKPGQYQMTDVLGL
ncbi:MAG: 4-hydroxy-tetrahydrodipicolinate reductase [Albimonas sp.]|uniref:4-hydroxy-tetrahydrodipicolinate reductase n=1 Tax=Albimonas sp. TaxID=1872425 RepID=UPI004056C17B